MPSLPEVIKGTKGKGALTEHLSWAKADLQVFTCFLNLRKEPEREGVISLVQMKILRLKECGFLA